MKLALSMHVLSIAAILTSTAYSHEPVVEVDQKAMQEAVLAWRKALGPELTLQATFEFDSPERTDWHFVPKNRVGVKWNDMNLEQRRAAHNLLLTALSSQGYFKATTSMSLENELRRIESTRPDVKQHPRPGEVLIRDFRRSRK